MWAVRDTHFTQQQGVLPGAGGAGLDLLRVCRTLPGGPAWGVLTGTCGCLESSAQQTVPMPGASAVPRNLFSVETAETLLDEEVSGLLGPSRGSAASSRSSAWTRLHSCYSPLPRAEVTASVAQPSVSSLLTAQLLAPP